MTCLMRCQSLWKLCKHLLILFAHMRQWFVRVVFYFYCTPQFFFLTGLFMWITNQLCPFIHMQTLQQMLINHWKEIKNIKSNTLNCDIVSFFLRIYFYGSNFVTDWILQVTELKKCQGQKDFPEYLFRGNAIATQALNLDWNCISGRRFPSSDVSHYIA